MWNLDMIPTQKYGRVFKMTLAVNYFRKKNTIKDVLHGPKHDFAFCWLSASTRSQRGMKQWQTLEKQQFKVFNKDTR